MEFLFTQDWLCSRIVEATPLAIVFADRDGLVRLWNRGAEAMFGYGAEEVLGRSMDFMIPDRHRQQHWEGYARVMQSGVTKYGHQVLAVPAIVNGGRRISIEFNVALLRSAAGDVIGAAATIQDVTERWERDKQLRARLAAAEAKHQQGEKVSSELQ
jgi:PAS domain S-box-containing protein